MSAEIRRRLRAARALIVLGSVLLVLAILATWIRAQIIDTDGWTQTSVQLLQNAQVRDYIAEDLSEQLLTVVDVQKFAVHKLPPALSPLAPALQAEAAEVLPRAVARALELPVVQQLWGKANRIAHARLMELLSGGGRTISTAGGVVSLNLEDLLDRIGQRIGVGDDVGAKLPPARRRVVLLRSRQLRVAQNLVKALRGLSVVLPLLVALLYLGALALAAGARRQALLDIGVGLVAGALVALLLRRWAESYVVDTLVLDEGARPALRAAMGIATAGWRSRALWLLVTGALCICAGWLAGPMRWARALRDLIATPLQRHPHS